MFLNKGTSQPEASQQEVNGDMASEWEELVELDDVQLATVVGGAALSAQAMNAQIRNLLLRKGLQDFEVDWREIWYR